MQNYIRIPAIRSREEEKTMGLFRKEKTPEEILAEGQAQYTNGDFKKAFITLHGLAAKGNPTACYYMKAIRFPLIIKNV